MGPHDVEGHQLHRRLISVDFPFEAKKYPNTRNKNTSTDMRFQIETDMKNPYLVSDLSA